MRAAGTIVAADGGVGVGGGLVTSFNARKGAVVPTAGDYVSAQIANTPLAPDTSTDLAAAYVFAARHKGDIRLVATLADLDEFAPADGGGKRTISVNVEQTGMLLVLPPTEYLEFVASSSWRGPLGNATIQGTVAGAALIRGEPLMTLMTIVNVAGPDVDLYAPSGSPVAINRCVLAGPVKAGTIRDIANFAVVSECAIVGGDGITVSGAVNIVRATDNQIAMSAANATGILVDASVVVTGNIEITRTAFVVTDPTSFAVYIDGGASAPIPGYLIQSCTNATGVFMDISSAGIDQTDIRVVAASNVGLRNSITQASSTFQDLANPVAVIGAADTWTVVPHKGLGSQLVAGAGQERWELIDTLDGTPLIPATPPTRWGLRFIGPRAISSDLIYTIVVKQNGGGTPNAQFRLEVDPLGDDTWAELPDSRSTGEMSARYVPIGASHAPVPEIKPGARFRLSMQAIGALLDALSAEYSIVGGGPL